MFELFLQDFVIIIQGLIYAMLAIAYLPKY
jgi:F0F1-type ATP synthase membrane subunit a